MSWYDELLNWTDQNPLESEYQKLCQQVRLVSMRLELAKAEPALSKQSASALYWQLEALKEQRNEIAKQLRSTFR